MTKWIWHGLAIGVSAVTPALALAQQMNPAAVPIVIAGMASGTLFVVTLLVLFSVSGTRRNRQRLELIERLLEKGQPVPPELLANKAKALPPRDQQTVDLRRGIALLGWGIGVAAFMYVTFGQVRATAWSLLFLCLSAASFVNSYFSGRLARAHHGHN